MIKGLAKNIICKIYSPFSYPLVVNSYGRSGSTVLKEGIVNGAVRNLENRQKEIVKSSIYQKQWDLSNRTLHDGVLYKTHDYPPAKSLKSNVRILYSFSDPVDVILSLLRLYEMRGNQWMRAHCNHLKIPYTGIYKLVDHDELQLENHLQSWLNESRYPVAFIRYETMWNYQDEISDFLGSNIELPLFTERKSKETIDDTVTRRVKKTYQSFQKRVRDLSDFFIHN